MKQFQSKWVSSRTGGAWLLGLLGALVIGAGCHQEVDIPPLETKTVQACGMTLDESATPEQVVYVLLQTLRSDVEAAQAGERAKQREAFATTFSLAAFDEIENRLTRTLGSAKGEAETRRERKIHEVINHWAPIVAFYVKSFEADAQKAMAAMKVDVSTETGTATVLYDVCHDPAVQDAAERETATLDIELVKVKTDSAAYWRVARVGFLPPRAKMVRPTTQPAAGTQPENKTTDTQR